MAEVCLIDLFHYPGDPSPEGYDPAIAAETVEDRLRQYARAEELGFDGVFLTEHHFTAYNLLPSPNVMLSSIAQRTKKMRLGVMANIVPFHQPVRLAEECAMLDVISNGRLEVGLGRGIDEPEFRRLRMSFDEARPRFIEGLELMVKAWSQETFSHKGDFYDIGEATIYPRPVQQPHPKVWVTANSPTTIEWTARNGYAMSTLLLPPEQTKQSFELFTKTAKEAGHDLGGDHFAVARHTVVAEDSDEARRIARNNFEAFVRLFKEAAMPKNFDDLGDDYAAWKGFLAPLASMVEDFSDAGFDHLCDLGLIIVGNPQEVKEQLVGELESLGADHFLAVMDFGYITREELKASQELFAKEVLPAVHALRNGAS